MRFGAASFTRLVCALRQNNSPFKAWPDEWPMLMMRSQTRLVQCAGREYWPQRRLDLNVKCIRGVRVGSRKGG